MSKNKIQPDIPSSNGALIDQVALHDVIPSAVIRKVVRLQIYGFSQYSL